MVAALAALVSAPSWAQADVPRYDPAAHCKRIASIGSSSAVIERTCLQTEQSAYDDLKRRWDKVPSETASHCDRIARVGGDGTYVILKTCIETETDAAENMPAFNF